MTNLIEDLKAYFATGQWAGGIEDEYDNIDILEDEIVGTSRWEVIHRAVYKRGDEYAAVQYREPATEMQERDYSNVDIYQVTPVPYTVVRYDKVTR